MRLRRRSEPLQPWTTRGPGLIEETRKAVLAWEERNPHEDEAGSYLEIDGRRVGPFYTFDEISLKNRASWIRYEMDTLHDRVMKVRDVIPPEPPAARTWRRVWDWMTGRAAP